MNGMNKSADAQLKNMVVPFVLAKGLRRKNPLQRFTPNSLPNGILPRTAH
jgi:hypothetical protein